MTAATLTTNTTEQVARVATVPAASSVAVQAMTVALPTGFPVEGRTVPFSIEKDQAYYWGTAWQVGVREAIAEIRAGEFTRFDSDDPTDAARWLLDGQSD